ncbi:alpha/beta hydrolase [Haloarchaeobius iranensis]|uniref:Phospholipase/carboxylesterase n=1 Tax=Haloarchaeobius iranensis TaxID=996166 RepID=A0A1G9XGB5_9EURY|nr:dienelactone hydrolase family protein [Haloarchaeobius iranensis]SDM95343.1 phospholipase/carboxylesterase [Haloarchaeobius iranensis]
MLDGPHADAQVLTAGASLDEARAAVVALHGRGATARSVLGLASELDVDDVAWLGPQATGNTWYPYSFMADTADNEPHLSSALELVDETVARAVDAGIPRERVVLLGFSQGACLASEYVARNATRFGGLVAFSGGLIGPEGTPREYDGDLDGTPVYLGCDAKDPHIPKERVHETRDVLTDLGADVTAQIFEGMGHTIIPEEVEGARDVLKRAVGDGE